MNHIISFMESHLKYKKQGKKEKKNILFLFFCFFYYHNNYLKLTSKTKDMSWKHY